MLMAKSGRSFLFLKGVTCYQNTKMMSRKKMLISAEMKVIFITAAWNIQSGAFSKGMRMGGARRSRVSIVYHISSKS
jgi:hypothetical protein